MDEFEEGVCDETKKYKLGNVIRGCTVHLERNLWRAAWRRDWMR